MQRADSSVAAPVAHQWVVLHRVGHDRAGPVDSVRSDARGRYAFRYTVHADSAVYFASATYGGVAYFTAPFAGAVVTGEDAELTVFDTTSAGPPLRTRSRSVIARTPSADGSRVVSDVFLIDNTGFRTRVGRDGAPVWSAMAPDGAAELRVDEATVAATAVRLRAGRVEFTAPIAPGIRQLRVSYRLPASPARATFVVSDSLDELEVVLEDSAAIVGGAKLVRVTPIATGSGTLQRLVAQAVPRNATFTIETRRTGAAQRGIMLGVVIALAGAVMFSGFVRNAFRASHASSWRIEAPADAMALAERIAALDAAHARRASPTEEERMAYRRERDALDAHLASILAERDNRL